MKNAFAAIVGSLLFVTPDADASCPLPGSEPYPQDGFVSVPTNALLGPECGSRMLRLSDNSEIPLSRTENRPGHYFCRANEALDPQAEYSGGIMSEAVAFRTGDTSDNKAPKIDADAIGRTTIPNRPFFYGSGCFRPFRIRLDDIEDDKEPLDQLRVGRLEEEELPVFLVYLQKDSEGYFVDITASEKEDTIEVAAIDGAGNVSEVCLVELHVDQEGCSCGYSEMFSMEAVVILFLAFFRRHARCRPPARERIACS